MGFLRFCNFGNVLSLQKFDVEDINKIEQMVKHQFKSWLDENTDETDYVDYFGPIYYMKPDQFTFTCGDMKMIQQISEYVQSTIRKKGYEYFQGKNSQCFQKPKRYESVDCELSEEELRDELYNAVLKILQPYGDHVISLFKKEMVVVTNENGEIRGLVHCVVCDSDIKTEKKMNRKRKNSYSQYWNGNKWIISNFANHHLQNVHPILHKANESDTDKQNPGTSHSILPVDDDLEINFNVQNSVGKCQILKNSQPKN